MIRMLELWFALSVSGVNKATCHEAEAILLKAKAKDFSTCPTSKAKVRSDKAKAKD